MQSAHSRGLSNGTIALAIAMISLVIAIFAIVYQFTVVSPRDARIRDQNQLIAKLTGVNNPRATNSLAPDYVDADKNLLADAPTDPAKQLDPSVLKFSYIAVDDQEKFRTAFKELMEGLSKATGKPVEFVEYSSIDEQLRALHDGELHIVGLNTGAVPIGVCAAGFVPMCMMADSTDAAGYQLQIIAAAKSDVTALANLKGKELTLTEPSSNSGYKAPIVLLRDNGMKPGEDYFLRYSQGHTASIRGIASGAYQSAAVASDVLKREVSTGAITSNAYRVIFTSDQTFPPAAIGIGHALKPELAEKIRATLLSFNWKGTGLETVFGPEGRAKFIAADYKKDWDYVRRIDESMGFTYALRAAPATAPTTAPTP